MNIFDSFPFWADMLTASLGASVLGAFADVLSISLTLGLFAYVAHRL